MTHHADAAFACGHCGASGARTGLEYDCLGYPICPRCGESGRSLAVARSDENPPSPKPLETGSDAAGGPTDGDQFRWVATR